MPKAKEKTAWTDEQVAALLRLARLGLNMRELKLHLPGLKTREVNEKLAELEEELHPRRISDIRRAGQKGVVFLREDVGGRIGVRWLCAHRSGAAFDTAKMEELLDLGLFVPAEIKNSTPAFEDHYVWKRD